MRYLCCVLLYVLVAAIGPASAVPPDLPGWDVAWFDEFAGNQLNTSLWTPIFSTNPTNNSLHAYLPSQVAVAGGNLVITSTNQPYQGLPYRSGQVISKVEQQFGKWEVRAKLPTTAGQWPAIWLLPRTGTYPWPSQGEIDIMENRGDEPHRTSSAFHWGTNPPYSHSFVYDEQSAHQDGQPENFHSEFHTYGVEWTDRQLRFFVDGVNHYTAHDADVGGFLSSQSANMETVINNAIGGDFLPNPNGSTVWPQQMLIDYVHVYSAAGTPAALVHENGSFDAGQSPLAGWSTFGVNDFGNVQPHFEAVRSGTSSAKLFGQFNGTTNYSGIEQGITVAPGDEVRALLHEFIRSADSIAGTGNELILKIDYYSEPHGKYGSSSYLSTDSVVVANGSTSNDVWLERELRSVAPEGAVEARMGIVFAQRSNAGGAVHVDDTFFGLWRPGDFDDDQDYSCADVDALVAEIVSGNHDPQYDLTQDSLVDHNDLTAWLAEAGAAENTSGDPFLPGDANLSGVVDFLDFNIWAANRFANNPAWCLGDFDASGVVDFLDFNIWASHRFQSAVVPEPSSMVVLLIGLVGVRQTSGVRGVVNSGRNRRKAATRATDTP